MLRLLRPSRLQCLKMARRPPAASLCTASTAAASTDDVRAPAPHLNVTDLFTGEEHAAAYAEYRPTYPVALYEELWRYCGAALPTDLAVDVATGSGQAAKEIASKFKHVVGLDVSEAQVAAAPPASNVTFRCVDVTQRRDVCVCLHVCVCLCVHMCMCMCLCVVTAATPS